MKEKVLFVLLEEFADWEYAFLATALQERILDKTSPYEVATVSISTEPIRSIGGFTILPDYDFDDCPQDFAGLMLIGGKSWRMESAKLVLPLLRQAEADEKMIGAICDATVFLGMHGFLNEKAHTSNALEDLSAAAQEAYTGTARYQQQQAVRDGNLITANGTGYLEFTREALRALHAYPEDYIESNYRFFKEGYIALTQGSAS